jgi:hypothetical protein
VRTVLLAAVLALTPTLGVAQPVNAPPSVADVLTAFAAAPQQPAAYRAAVTLHVRMRVFPFVKLTLHGESSYEPPGHYRFSFRGVPLLARAFSKMTYDLGDATTWAQNYAIAFAPGSTADAPVLRLVPQHAALVRWLDVALDPARGRITRITWARSDRGTITLAQTYAPGSAGHDVVALQDATIDLPAMKAELRAEYAEFSKL